MHDFEFALGKIASRRSSHFRASFLGGTKFGLPNIAAIEILSTRKSPYFCGKLEAAPDRIEVAGLGQKFKLNRDYLSVI
jgi:hypothetical protein